MPGLMENSLREPGYSIVGARDPGVNAWANRNLLPEPGYLSVVARDPGVNAWANGNRLPVSGRKI